MLEGGSVTTVGALVRCLSRVGSDVYCKMGLLRGAVTAVAAL